jgi:hypothetical protein
VTLRLPSFKARHLLRYRAVLPRLEHDISRERERDGQAGVWDRGMAPPSPDGMHPEVYLRGERMGLSRNRILRPNWSRDVEWMPMTVDHVIELQVLTDADIAAWGDSYANYELLDGSSNSSSGSQIRRNIAQERAELVAYYNDPSWFWRILHFDRVVADSGPRGQGWVKEEIIWGEHLDALDEHQRHRGGGP